MRPLYWILLIPAGLVLQLGSFVVAAEPLTVLLEKGIYAEETLGDLDEAIRIYGQISAKSKAERPIAAQAQFRQGRCLLAKGDQARAAAAFRALISDYPDQKDLVAEAEKLLGDLRAAGQNPPAVFETQPRVFDNAVPATLREIRVTFDQKMKDNSWSWTVAEAETKPAGGGRVVAGGDVRGGGGLAFAGPERPRTTATAPPLTGRPRYDHKKTTCSVPVELKAATIYQLEINVSPTREKFQSTQGTAAQPYVILFATQGDKGKPTPIPDDLAAAARGINEWNRSLDRIRADIYILRQQVVIGGWDGWMGAAYRLTQDGRRAVPDLAMELMRRTPDDQGKRRAIALTLRAIGDLRAVPALIRELPKCPYREGSDCTVHLPTNEEWARFIRANQAEPIEAEDKRDRFAFHRAVTEINGALEKITGHSEGDKHLDGRPNPAQSMKFREEVARRWQAWWDANASSLLTPEELAEVKRWPGMSRQDPVEEAGLRILGPTVPTGPEYSFGPEKEMVIRTHVLDREGYGGWKMGDTYVDLDTGRAYGGRPYPDAGEPWDARQRRREAQWDEERGIDIYVQSSGSDELEKTQLTMHNCLGWALEPGAWPAMVEAVGRPEPLKLPPMSFSYSIRKKGNQFVDTFLFKTREGGVALLQVQEAILEEWSVKFRYRMLCRKDASGSLVQVGDLRSRVPPTGPLADADKAEPAPASRPAGLPVQDWTKPLDEREHQRGLLMAEQIILDRLRSRQAVEKAQYDAMEFCQHGLTCLAKLNRAGVRELLLEAVDPEIRPSVTFARILRKIGDKRVEERIRRALADSNSPASERVKWLRLWYEQDPRMVLPPEVEDYIVKTAFEDPEFDPNPVDPSNWVNGWMGASLTRAVTERSRSAFEKRLLAEISNTQARPDIGWHDGPSRLCAHIMPGAFSPCSAKTCVKALVHINNSASKDVLLRVVREGPPNGVRACAAIGLHHFGSDAEKKLAIGALRDIYRQLKWVPVREEYAFRMAYLGDAYGLQQLRGFMHHKDASIRGQAYCDLREIDDRSFISVAAKDRSNKDDPNDFERIVNWGNAWYKDKKSGEMVLKECVYDYLYEVLRTSKSPSSSRAMSTLFGMPDEKLMPVLPLYRTALAEPIPSNVFDVPYSLEFWGQSRCLIGLIRVGSPEEKRRAMERLAELFAVEERLKSHPTMVINALKQSRYKPAQRLLLHIMETYPAATDMAEKPDVPYLAACAFLLIETGDVGGFN